MSHRKPGECTRQSCDRRMHRGGLCRTHYTAVPHGYIDATAAVEHYKQLRRMGLSTAEIARRSGVHRDTLRQMGTWSAGNVRIETHQLVMAVRIPRAVEPSLACIPAVGTHRRVQALAVIGHSLRVVGARMGVTQQAVTAMLRKQVVTAATAAKVADVYRELHLTPGTSVRAANFAIARGWAPPLAWDDDTIDDPTALPQHDVHRHVPFAERYVEVRDHCGITDIALIAEKLGQEVKSVKKQCLRRRDDIAQLEGIAS